MKKLHLLVLSITMLFSLGIYASVHAGNVDPALYQKTEKVYETVEKSSSKISLVINADGSVQFGGAKFVSLNGSNINITVYGLPLTLSTNSSTQVSGVASISNMAVGDTLSGKASINQSTGVITALSVRDESQNQQKITDLENQIKALLEQLKKLQSEMKGVGY